MLSGYDKDNERQGRRWKKCCRDMTRDEMKELLSGYDKGGDERSVVGI